MRLHHKCLRIQWLTMTTPRYSSISTVWMPIRLNSVFVFVFRVVCRNCFVAGMLIFGKANNWKLNKNNWIIFSKCYIVHIENRILLPKKKKKKSIFMSLFLCFVVFLVAAVEAQRKNNTVLLMYADSFSATTDVKANIVKSSLFQVVDVFDCQNQPPTFDQLKVYLF